MLFSRNRAFFLCYLILFFGGISNFTAHGQGVPPSQRGSRCADAILICQTETIQSRSDSTFLTEAPPQLPCFPTSANLSLVRNGIWYKIRIYRSGSLGFTLRPLTSSGRTDSTANYDWAVFKASDSAACGALSGLVACNSARRPGITGAAGIVQNEFDEPNLAYSEVIPNVRQGEEYLLLVLNPNNHRTGFILDFGFSSPQGVVLQPDVVIRSISAPARICLTNTVTVRFSDLLRVSSVVPNAFRFESERGVVRPITSISAQRFGLVSAAITDAYDSVFTFQFNEPISQTETYRLRALRDIPSLCSVLPEDATTATVISVGPRVEIRGLRSYCSGVGARLSASSDRFSAYLWTNLSTGRVVSSSSTVVVPEGEYRLSVIDANGCMGETSAIVRSTSAVVLTLTASNSRSEATSRFCNFPDRRDYVLLQATPEFDRYEWLVNGVVTTGTISENYIFEAPGRYQVRAFANGCMAESNVINVQMSPIPTKPQIRQIGNYLTVVNRLEPSSRYYWVRVNRSGTLTGLEFGYDFSPTQNGTYFVQGSNAEGCFVESDTIIFVQTPVRVRLSTGSYQANHGRPFTMNFQLTNITRNVLAVGGTSVTFTVRMDARILGPSPSVQLGLVSQTTSTSALMRRVTCSWSVALSNNAVSSTIGSLRMLGTLLPSSAMTSLLFENAFSTTPTGKRINGITFELETTGSFRIANAPANLLQTTSGTAELEQIAERVQKTPSEASSEESESLVQEQANISLSTYPNPVLSEVSVRLVCSAEMPVTAWIQDAFGNLVKRCFDNERLVAGNHERTFSLADVPHGVYVLVVRTPHKTHSSLLSIRR